MPCLTATTVSDLWFQALAGLEEHTYRQDISRGSFAGGFRLQYPFVCGTVLYPLDDYVPDVPAGVAPPTTKEYVQRYFEDYLLGARIPSENEQYTYASRIGSQLEKVITMLTETPLTNQASIIVGRPEDVDISDPACLRAIDFKIVRGTLELTSFWRSHDLWAGLPTNLGGLALLQATVAEAAGLPVGVMHYASSGAHVYDYQLPSVEAKLGRMSR